jgi:DNA ligase-1
MTTKLLDNLNELTVNLNKTNSTLEKRNILSDYDNLKKIIKYTYNSYMKFNITSKVIKKYDKPIKKNAKKYKDIYKLLEDLSNRVITGHDAVESVITFIEQNIEYEDIILNIIDKDLKIRMGVKEINKVFPDLIPTFEVALANPLDGKEKLLKEGDWYISRKFDGVRCIAIVINNQVEFYSRTGKEFTTLGVVGDAIVKELKVKGNYVLDGEICLVNDDGKEDFKSVMKEIKKKNHTIGNPRYYVFDILSLEEFQNRIGEEIYSTRLSKLKDIFSKSKDTLRLVEQVKYTPKSLIKMKEKSSEKEWEGLMLRKDDVYKGKRSNDILKVKLFQTEEYKVIDITTGPIQMIDKKTGLNKTVITLSAVIIKHKDCEVSVGSGFTMDERNYFYKNKNKIIGKVISVQYFEEIETDGCFSLRFPTYKGLYGKKRDM